MRARKSIDKYTIGVWERMLVGWPEVCSNSGWVPFSIYCLMRNYWVWLSLIEEIMDLEVIENEHNYFL